MKYVSIDLETTGLDPETCQVLQIGMVIEDTVEVWPSLDTGRLVDLGPNGRFPPVEDLPTFNAVIVRDRYVGEPYALGMHADIFKAIAEFHQHGTDRAIKVRGRECYFEDAGRVYREAMWWLKSQLGEPPFNAAGKNLGSFDWPFLPASFTSLFRHRLIDAGNVALGARPEYWMKDRLPSLGDLTGETVAHDAVGDAQDVIRVLRTTYPGQR